MILLHDWIFKYKQPLTKGMKISYYAYNDDIHYIVEQEVPLMLSRYIDGKFTYNCGSEANLEKVDYAYFVEFKIEGLEI